MPNKIFGKRLKHLRQERELSQTTLATGLNCLQAKISKLELNQIEPDIDFLIQLSVFFDVSIDYLLGKSEYPYTYDPKRKGEPGHI
jgi:transcriptional regulator with XRE-family HTH domain